MRYLVTGATGALGSAVVGQLAHRDARIRAFVRDESAFLRQFPDVPTEVVGGDALVPADVRRAASDCDAVVHCVDFPLTSYELHADAAAVLATATPDGTPVVLPVDARVFGEPATVPITPETPYDPATRLAEFDVDAVERLERSALPTTVVHLPELYGPNVENRLSQRLVGPAMAGQDVRFPAPVDVPHEFLYVDDAARSLVAVAEDAAGNAAAGTAENRRYTVGANRTITVREFGALVYDAADTDGEIRSLPDWVLRVAGLVSEDARAGAEAMRAFHHERRLDGSAILEDVGFSPRVDYEEGAERTVAWFRERREAPVET